MASVIFASIDIFITKISIPKNIYSYYLLLKAKEKFTRPILIKNLYKIKNQKRSSVACTN